MLYRTVVAEETLSIDPSLPQIMQLAMDGLELLFMIVFASKDLLPEKVQLVTTGEDPSVLYMQLGSLFLALLLPVKRQLVIAGEEEMLCIPIPLLAVKVDFFTVILELELRMAMP
jgi:hypothetical protein